MFGGVSFWALRFCLVLARSRVIRFARSSLAYNTRALCGVSSRLSVIGSLFVALVRGSLSLLHFVWLSFGRLARYARATRSRSLA